MTILSLDTASAAGSAALVRDGDVLIECAGDASRTHGERLPRELMRLLEEARVRLDQISGYAVATGPGSFTGLRIGIATIQGLALAQGKLVTAVSSFEALRSSIVGRRSSAVTSASATAVWIDAHRGEVFAMLYAPDGRVLEEATSLLPGRTLDTWSASLDGAPRIEFAGDGAVKYRPIIEQRLGPRAGIPASVPPLAGAIGLIAAREPARAAHPHAVVPLYVRRSDAELARDRRRPADGA